MGYFSWEEKDLLYLKEQWGQISASTIAANLGTNKNSVIGKAHRLKLPKIKPAFKRARKQKVKKISAKKCKIYKEIAAPVIKAPKAFTMTKRGKCQWIEGDPVKFRTSDEGKCGKPTVYKENGTRSAYCLKHTKKASRFIKAKELENKDA